MSTPSLDLARAAVAALSEALQEEGQNATPEEVLRLVTLAAEESAGTLTVTIASPTGDAGSLIPAVTASVEKKTGKKVLIKQTKDVSLIGGATVSYGDERIDLSVKRSLEDAELLFTTHS
jgi:F-type H+-transporting ATPase subunit delta